MTAPLFTDLRDLLAKATKRPWERGTGARLTIWADNHCIFEDAFQYAELADADLIVAAVNALPALVEVAEAAQKVRSYYHGESPGDPSNVRQLEADLDEVLARLRDA